MIGPQEISSWLKQSGRTSEHVQDDTAEWHIVTRSADGGSPIEIVCSKKRPHLILLGRQTSLSEEHQRAVSELDGDAYREFRFHLTRDLLLSGRAQYKLDIDDNKKRLNGFTVVKTIWRDDATPRQLLEAVQDVHDLSTLTVSRIKLAAGKMP